MSQTAPAQPQLQPLTCPSCAGPVPLADADVAQCPYCAATVPIPENLRQLRRDLLAITAERRAAERLYRRIGKPPARILRAFVFFEAGWFWMFGLGFWIAAGIALFVVGVPVVGELLFRVNTWDVLTDAQGSMISIGGTLGTVVLGLLLAGWSHKRVTSVGALQAALAASPPHSPGGPARCRRCAAALVLAPGALGARCDYCHADNLVSIPAEWVMRAGRIKKTIAEEENAAIAAEAQSRRSLRWSLFWRLLLGGGVISLFVLPLGAADSRSVSRDDVELYGEPNFLPTWTRAEIHHWSCEKNDFGFPGYPMVLSHCRNGPCEDAYLEALAAGKPYTVSVQGAPLDTEVSLDRRRMGTFEARWETVARSTLNDSNQATLLPPLSGWYRLRIRGGDRPSRINWCGHQD